MTTILSLKEQVNRVLDELPAERLVEVLDFALFVKARVQKLELRRMLVRPDLFLLKILWH